MIPQPLFQVILVDPDFVFLRKKLTQSETRRSTQYEANLNRTWSIGATHKIWKMRFMVPYNVFMAPSWPRNCLNTSWAHPELLKIVLTNLYVELTASKVLKSIGFSKSVHLAWLYVLSHSLLVMLLYCAKKYKQKSCSGDFSCVSRQSLCVS